MKFIIDAHLPRKLSIFLQSKAFDAIHTLDLPEKNATDDEVIREITVQENRILITKDSDFEDSFWLKNIPPKFVLVTTGNITNAELISLFDVNFSKLVELLQKHNFIEIDRNHITVHA